MKRKENVDQLLLKGMFFILCIGFVYTSSAQSPYQVDVTGVNTTIRKGHLDLGGKSITGESIEVNNFYIERNGKPFIPVMGEFHYCRFPSQYWDEEIKKMMDVPIYTATGWGYASVVKNGSIPVMAGYAYPFWEAENKPSPFYLFKNIHKTPDYSPVSYVSEDYPSFAAELGTGICVTYSRRPRVIGESFLPLMIRTIGSGSNGLGYYIYHGGTTPSDGFYMYSEGSGLNLKSYDYQAPIGEWGNVTKGYYGLKVVNTLLKHFGAMVAPLFPVIPETNAGIKPEDTTTLRYSVRTDGSKGFLFMHNFQDHIKTPDLKGLQIKVKTNDGLVSFPEVGTFTLKSGASAIFPFNIAFGGVTFI